MNTNIKAYLFQKIKQNGLKYNGHLKTKDVLSDLNYMFSKDYKHLQDFAEDFDVKAIENRDIDVITIGYRQYVIFDFVEGVFYSIGNISKRTHLELKTMELNSYYPPKLNFFQKILRCFR